MDFLWHAAPLAGGRSLRETREGGGGRIDDCLSYRKHKDPLSAAVRVKIWGQVTGEATHLKSGFF